MSQTSSKREGNLQLEGNVQRKGNLQRKGSKNKKKTPRFPSIDLIVDLPYLATTTLHKHVPVIHRDNREAEIDAIIQKLKDEGLVSERQNIELYKQDHGPELERMRLTGGIDAGQPSVTVAPVLQLISLNIYNRLKDDIDWNLQISYGEITMTDRFNNLFYLYKSGENQVKLNPQRTNLPLGYTSMAPLTTGLVRFSFTTDDASFNGETDLSNSTQEENGSYTLELDGVNGYFAEMRFTKIPYAVLIRISFELEDDVNKRQVLGVYGNITVNDVVTLCSGIDDLVQMKHGRENCICCLETVFAVPIGQPVRIKAKLYSDNGCLLFHNDNMIKHPNLYFPNADQASTYRSHVNKSIRFCMDENWYLHEDIFNPYRGLNATWSSYAALERRRSELVASERNLVEIFSVILGNSEPSKANARLALCGKILVRDAHADNYIFLRIKEGPNLLRGQSSKNIALAWPSLEDGWIVEKDFLMHFNLEDSQGNKVCVGSFEFPTRVSATSPYDAPYNRGMCEYIQGDDDYFVAVYYSVFQKGKKASVSIKWKGCESRVYGSVVAKQGYRSLSSCDEDTKFGTSSLFERSKKDGIWATRHSELRLSKYRVSTSSRCDKITISVNLFHGPYFDPYPAPFKLEHTQGDIELEAGVHEKIVDLDGIMVKVKWF